MASQNQKFCLAGLHASQDRADPFLLFSGAMDLLRGGRSGTGMQQTKNRFVAGASGAAAKFVERRANGDAIEPPFHLFCLSLRTAPRFKENIDGQFLRPSAVSNNTSNDSSNASVMFAKHGFDGKWNFLLRIRLRNDFGC